MDPPWLVVLRHWLLVEGKHGLTLPFLVGVQRYVSGDVRGATARNGLREILEQARAQTLEHQGHFLIFPCGDRDTWVLREVRDTRPYSAELLLPPADHLGRCTLATAIRSPPADRDPVEHLLDVLCADVAEAIDRETYSREGRYWRGIDEDERRWIDGCLSNGLLPLGPSDEWLRGQAWFEATKR